MNRLTATADTAVICVSVSRGQSVTTMTQYIMTTDMFTTDIVQELCESRGGRPGLSVLTSLLASVDVKIY